MYCKLFKVKKFQGYHRFIGNCESFQVIGIQVEQEREWKTGTGTCKNHCYSSDFLPVKFTELVTGTRS